MGRRVTAARGPVFADTSFLYPYVDVTNAEHDLAVATFEEFSPSALLVTDGVLGELMALMSRQSRRSGCLRFLDRAFGDDPDIRVIAETHEAFLRGVQRYRVQTTGSPSLVDCMIMNAMDEAGVEDLFAFDRDFRHVGLYRVHPLRD